MILFHGSDKIIERPMALFGRNKVDFGQGFYLTNLHDIRNFKPTIWNGLIM